MVAACRGDSADFSKEARKAGGRGNCFLGFWVTGCLIQSRRIRRAGERSGEVCDKLVERGSPRNGNSLERSTLTKAGW